MPIKFQPWTKSKMLKLNSKNHKNCIVSCCKGKFFTVCGTQMRQMKKHHFTHYHFEKLPLFSKVAKCIVKNYFGHLPCSKAKCHVFYEIWNLLTMTLWWRWKFSTHANQMQISKTIAKMLSWLAQNANIAFSIVKNCKMQYNAWCFIASSMHLPKSMQL